ncbi:response regulator receiver protein [[Leptolyngbya] sp. PCC 7376]|uniref:response regulator n=1 Tax=[Leptolyngbya] sp. PCC 7376 TaxID=111781 RepID=UPI00029F279F|nr:response regulator [[Leptolyngbya] sp. PCC 7376]AFY37104.1 response regulator receiver protein [[Leptolyngbya] sp. PCC 7376]
MEVQDTATKKVVIPGKALQSLILKKLSGTVTIFDPSDESVYWHLHFGDGKLHYATSGIGKRERLEYLLKLLFPNTDFPIPNNLTDEYSYVCKIWQMGKFSLKQVRQVLYFLTQEAITQVLALPRAAMSFKRSSKSLDPLLLSLALKQMVRPLQDQIRSVVQLRSEISSPFERLYLENVEQIVHQSWLNVEDYEFVESIVEELHKKNTLYELSFQVKQTTIQLGTLLKPLIQAGGIRVLPYQELIRPERPLIACIDDSKATQRIVKMTLEASGFQVVGVTEPAQALTTFARQRPEVILMDINMPDIDGYELCRMFNQSRILKNIPVVMLTGRDGLLDRIRARMVGASDFIAKPFNPQELIQLVQSYLPANLPESKLS